MDLFDIYIKCQAGNKDELNKLFESDNNGGVAFRFNCLKKIVNHAKAIFPAKEKKQKGNTGSIIQDRLIHQI